MTAVTAADVVLLLHREAVARNRPELAIRACTLRKWRQRGRIGPGPGYRLDEVIAYIDRRGRLAA